MSELTTFDHNMMKDLPTSVRLDPGTLKRVDALVPVLQESHYGDLGIITRSKVLRLAVLRGVQVLEAEAKSKAKK